MRLRGKVALVTGGTAGIGAGIVEMMTDEGASVAFTGRSAETGTKLQERLRERGAAATYEANADRVQELGLGRRLDFTRLDPGLLRSAITELAGDSEIRSNLARMREHLRANDGAARGADALEAYLEAKP